MLSGGTHSEVSLKKYKDEHLYLFRSEACIKNGDRISLQRLREKLTRRKSKKPFNEFFLRVNLEHYPEGEFMRGTSILVPVEHAKTVYDTGVVEEKYWYWDEKGAAYYIMMTQEKSYDVLGKTLELLQREISAIVDKAFKFFKDAYPNTRGLPPIEIVVLGVGSAIKENLLLTTIIRRYGYPYKNEFGPIQYVPVDVSFPLLANSLRSLFANKVMKECILQENLVVSPVLTDFLKIRSDFLEEDVGKLIIAQGIVWNAPIPDLFSAFRRLMTLDSLLFIDVEFVGGRTDEQITSNYRGKAAKAFFYHPLELLHNASQAEQKNYFIINGHAVLYSIAFGDLSEKKGEIIPVIVKPDTFEEFAKQYSIPMEARSSIRLSPDGKSKTVVMLYKPKVKEANERTIVLGYSTRFEYDEFKKFLNEAGFEIFGEWLDNPKYPQKAVFGHYLLRLGDQHQDSKAVSIGATSISWTKEEIHQALTKAGNGSWIVQNGSKTGGQEFDHIAEKEGRLGFGGDLIVCDIEKSTLTPTRIDNFLEKASKAKRHMSRIKKATLFCDKDVAHDVYEYFEKKAEEVQRSGLRFYLVRNTNDLKSLEKEL